MDARVARGNRGKLHAGIENVRGKQANSSRNLKSRPKKPQRGGGQVLE
jgi:hypothetical protein